MMMGAHWDHRFGFHMLSQPIQNNSLHKKCAHVRTNQKDFSTFFHDWQCCYSVGSWATCDAEINGDLLDAFLEKKATGSPGVTARFFKNIADSSQLGQVISPRCNGQATSKLEAPGDYLGHLAASHIVTSRPTDGSRDHQHFAPP